MTGELSHTMAGALEALLPTPGGPDTGQRVVDARGEIAIGIRRAGQDGTPGGGVALNPGRDERLQLNENDALIMLTTQQ